MSQINKLTRDIRRQFHDNNRRIEDLIKDFAHADLLRNLICENQQFIRIMPELIPTIDDLPVLVKKDRRRLLLEFQEQNERIISLIGFLYGCAESINNFSEELAQCTTLHHQLFQQVLGGNDRHA